MIHHEYLQVIFVCIVLITVSSLIKFYIMGENVPFYRLIIMGVSHILLYSAANLIMAIVYAVILPVSWLENLKKVKSGGTF